MPFGIRGTVIAMAAAVVCFGSGAARAGDDGAAPLWEGVYSIFSPLVGLGHEEKDPIDYYEHGKIVVPKSMDLPQPGEAAVTTGGAWPVNQEVQRKKVAKEEAKMQIAGVGDARLRYNKPFPNAPVTVRASDQPDGGATEQTTGGKAESTSVLGNLNPLGWVGIGKSTPLGPEPDRKWLTDPPTGYRAPSAPTAASATKPAAPTGQAPTGQASN